MQATNRQLQQLSGALILADLTKRPPFLTRNIEQRFQDEKDKRQRPKIIRLEREKFDPTSAIHFTTTMNQRLTPVLKVSVNGVSPSGRRTSSQNQSIEHRGRGNVIDVRCRLDIQINSARGGNRVLFKTSRIVRLHGERQHDGKFSLAMSLIPGELPLDFFMEELDDIRENEITWRVGMAVKYSMRFEFQFRTPKEAKQVFDGLDVDTIASPQDGLWAVWTELPRCPTTSQHLPIFVANETTTKFVLNVKMGWGTEQWVPRTTSKRPATPMECLHILKRHKSNTQLLTPASTPRSNLSTASTDVAVRYHVNGRVVTMRGYHCLYKCPPFDMGSVDRLESHLANRHICLDFEITIGHEAIEETSVDIIITKNDDLSSSKPSRRSGRSGARRGLEKSDSVIEDFDWESPVHPDVPLTLQQVTHDERTRWIPGAHYRVSETPQIATLPPAFAPTAEIRLELPERLRRRYPVVPYRGLKQVAFVSSDNKAALTTGELLSDEDDNTDESHLAIARKVQMSEQVSEPKARKFLLDINAHIESETIHGDKYLGPCLRRWLEKRKVWMKDKDIAKMYEDFIYKAYNREYMSREVYEECMHVSKETRNDERILREPSPQQTARRAKDTCSCGREFVSVRDRILCSNKVS
jgi:hypothetical protein